MRWYIPKLTTVVYTIECLMIAGMSIRLLVTPMISRGSIKLNLRDLQRR